MPQATERQVTALAALAIFAMGFVSGVVCFALLIIGSEAMVHIRLPW